nr:PREDICTED: zinc finger protein 233 [Megachile rotundata]
MANNECLVNTLQQNTYLPNVSLHQYGLASGSSSSNPHPASLMYNFPAMLGMYASRMDQAVERVHLQDAAAKQMKKLRPKKFRCELCDVAFSNNGQLKGHIRIHTGERPFKCDAEGCGKSFTRNEELTRHKRIHTGVRPHGCIVCGKHFGRKDHLKKHMRTHENRDPYRVSAAALGMFAIGQVLPPAPPFPPYLYPF